MPGRKRVNERSEKVQGGSKSKAVRRAVRPLYALVVLGLAIAVLQYAPFGGSTDPSPPSPEPTRFDPGVRPTPQLDDLGGAVDAIRSAVDDGDWDAAYHHTTRLQTLWTAFRREMRGGGGERFWQLSDARDFEVSLSALEASVQDRNADAARHHLADLDPLIERYGRRRVLPPDALPREMVPRDA